MESILLNPSREEKSVLSPQLRPPDGERLRQPLAPEACLSNDVAIPVFHTLPRSLSTAQIRLGLTACHSGVLFGSKQDLLPFALTHALPNSPGAQP